MAGSLLIALGTGCSSSEPTAPTTQEAAAPEPGPSLSLLYTTPDEGLVLHDAQANTSRTLVPGAEAAPSRATSPSGDYLALTYSTADSSHLSLLDLTTHRLERMHAAAGPVTYSLAWHPDSRQDRLAFGHYRPTEDDGRGVGGVQIVTPGKPPRDVGCNTVREVLHWLPNGALAARTEDNLFVVATEDCATQASLDARRMYHIRFAPNGQQMAFIHRELVYDRSAGEYVPDSSLVLSGPQGENRETLFGDERRVRHLRWAPDGSELAFDVAAEESGHRQVVVYDGNRPSFLTSPDATTDDQMHPRWSPSGSRLAFALRTDGGTYAAVRMQGQTRRLGRTQGSVWGWLDEQSVVVPGPDSVRVQSLTGTTRFTHPTPATLLHVWSRSPS
jgi:Tol biopolymer transport system component